MHGKIKATQSVKCHHQHASLKFMQNQNKSACIATQACTLDSINLVGMAKFLHCSDGENDNE